MLEAGAYKNAATEHKTTPLMFAAEKGHLEVVRLLLVAGAYKNAATEHKTTPLMFAAEKGHLQVVRLGLTRMR